MMHYAPPEEKNPEQRAFTMFLYVICCLAAIVQYAQTLNMLITGCIVTALAGFMVKAQRLTAKGTIYASHVEWTARTISIGTKYLFPLAIIIGLYLIYDTTGLEKVRQALAKSGGDDVGGTFNLIRNYMLNNEERINSITNWALTPPVFWWVRRCWVGLMRADKHEPIDYPEGIL